MACSILFVPDTHAPFCDMRAFNRLLRKIEALKPDRIIQQGDLADAYLLNRFRIDPSMLSKDQVYRERKQVREILSSLSGIAPVDLLLGNHCQRLKKRLADVPTLAWYVAAEPNLPEGVREPVPLLTIRTPRGIVKAVHGHRAPKIGGTGAYSMVRSRSVVTAHTHRAGLIWVTRDLWAMETGFLGKFGAPCFDYCQDQESAGWVHAFGWLDDEGFPHLEAL